MHEISEADHRILNPFSDAKLSLLGEICRLEPGMRHLDLACGKGEMLSTWAKRWGISSIGVDISPVFLQAARERAVELGVHEEVTFVEGDAGAYVAQAHDFDIVSCLGATWIGGGLEGTLRLMLPALCPGGLILVGEPFWNEPPPDDAYTSSGIGRDDFTSLAGTLDRFESVGLELVEMVLADDDNWERYTAGQWWTVDQWLRTHPDHPDSQTLREWNARNRRDYLEFRRRYLGWGVFVLRQTSDGA